MLSYNSTDPLAADTDASSPEKNDMILRWRLAMRYDTTGDQLTSLQAISSPDATTASASVGGTSIPSGTAEQLAQQLVASPNVSFQTPQEEADFKTIETTGHQTACGDPAISTTLLGVLLNITTKYQIVIGVLDDGHSCGGFHSAGEAVDLNGITPLDGSYPGTGNFINWHANEQPLLKQFDTYVGTVLAANGGGGIGQQQCFTSVSAPTFPSNVTPFADTCTHQHIDVGHR
jgi:hypothetical protein